MEAFVAAHKDFRIIAIGTPVPPYPGFPLDPPFRSRFQGTIIHTVCTPSLFPQAELAYSGRIVRYLDPLASSRALSRQQISIESTSNSSSEMVDQMGNAMTALQVVKEMRELCFLLLGVLSLTLRLVQAPRWHRES